MNTVPLLSINFYKGTYATCLLELQNIIADKATALIVTPNPEMLYEASQDGALLDVLKNANYALPDGAGIFVAYQIAQSRLPKLLKYLLFPYWCVKAIIHDEAFSEKYGERITGARLTRDLLAYAQKN
jgi:UDP-N-acetyl-D-mannosaminuronic acid transferase (WecB/TagA/CpsF family)